jgi:hypothetical protein
MGQIRFRIENLYDSGQGGVITGSRLANPAAAGRWQGVQLVPVHEFSWDSQLNVAAYQ